MHLIEIDAIRLQTPQAVLAGPLDMHGRQTRLIRPLTYPTEDLRRQNDLFTTPAALREPTAHDLLGPALSHLPAIDVCRIEKIDSQFQRPIHNGETVRLARLRPEVHGAETESADLHS